MFGFLCPFFPQPTANFLEQSKKRQGNGAGRLALQQMILGVCLELYVIQDFSPLHVFFL